jgi:hypothetical protein
MSTLQKPKKTTRDRDELEGTLLPPAPAPIPMDDPLRLPVASAVAEFSVAALPAGATDGNEASSSFTATTPGSSAAASATAVPSASSPDIPTVAAVPVVAAVPINQYEYPSQDAAAEKEKEAGSRGQVAAASAATDDDAIPSAPFLPTYDDSFAEENRDYGETAELHHGNRKGKIQSGEEIEDIDRARRKINAKQWNEREAIRQANEEAQRRNRSGVQIKKDTWFKYESEKPAYKEKGPDNVAYAKKKGGGYKVAEYDSMYEDKEYETKEYKTTEYKSVYDD